MATQAIFFGLELLGHEPRGLGSLLRQRSRRCRSAVDAEVPKQQATQRTPAITSYCLLTRRERACLVTLINTASELSASMSYDPKVVNLSVVYGCDRVASFGAL